MAANGTILPFKALQEHYNSALWAIQSTPDVPFDSVEATAGFYYREIKKQRPSGPYRLAGFSGTCVITYALALLFEATGDIVERLVMLDHFRSSSARLFGSGMPRPCRRAIRPKSSSARESAT